MARGDPAAASCASSKSRRKASAACGVVIPAEVKSNRGLCIRVCHFFEKERCDERNRSSEVKRRLFGKILLLGGVARTAGLAQYLEWRIATCWQLAPETGGDGIERVEVATLPCSPDALVWQGAALLPTMSTAREMWVLRHEWHGRGVASLREGCAFAW